MTREQAHTAPLSEIARITSTEKARPKKKCADPLTSDQANLIVDVGNRVGRHIKRTRLRHIRHALISEEDLVSSAVARATESVGSHDAELGDLETFTVKLCWNGVYGYIQSIFGRGDNTNRSQGAYTSELDEHQAVEDPTERIHASIDVRRACRVLSDEERQMAQRYWLEATRGNERPAAWKTIVALDFGLTERQLKDRITVISKKLRAATHSPLVA